MNVKIESSTRVQVSPSVYSRPFGEELVLLDFGRGEYFAIDEVGAAAYRRLETGASVGETAEGIARTYEVSPETALADIVELVEQLVDEGLFYVSENSPV